MGFKDRVEEALKDLARPNMGGEVTSVVPWMKPGTTTVAADVLPIPVTHGFVSKTTGADAEALTLADGEPGQVLVIHLATDGGGTGTLTPSTATGWATCAFADAGDTLAVQFIDSTIGWIPLGGVGTAAPPVLT